MEGQAKDAAPKNIYSEAKATQFHFKSRSKRRGKHDDSEDKDERRKSHRESRRQHKERHRASRDHHPSTRDGGYSAAETRHRESLYDDLSRDDAEPPADVTDSAFRESLFDALADDEGAAYWEGVYGQPIHVYPNAVPGPDGALEQMSDEQYASYVRGKMWEKSHQHIVQEQEAYQRAQQKRREERKREDKEFAREEASREAFEKEEREQNDIRRRMEESLKRGEERKKSKELEAAWDQYVAKWQDLKNAQHLAQETSPKARELIPWPVFSGKDKHVAKDNIERFLRGSKAWKDDPSTVLKVERVRWHPDKMQQRFGQHLDTETMKLVTSVFQVIDHMWNDRR
ncbi:hypothetical protein IQ07DRAFT_588975 [Pyrenochaeta sp. DS3sAY3a]|nr:hypothetical protein IQ07DRAFT_588975 [Pyrenochaeta sp. DS3sAY3a]